MIYKEIKDIEIGDFVQGETSVNQVIDIEKPDLGTRLLYSLNDGPYFVTEEHPFKTEDGWKSINPKQTYEEHYDLYNIDFEEGVKELKEGDVLITSNGKEELKSIKWKCANEQTVYNLKLSGDHTYYADGYLVHNKSNRFVGSDTKWYDGIPLRDNVVKPWNEMVERAIPDAQEQIEFLQRDFLGAFATGGDSDDEQVEQSGGGQMAAAQAELDQAVQTFKNEKQDAKMKQMSGFKDVGAQFKKQSSELTAMIGKTNLAGAAERQKQELSQESVKAAGDVSEGKDVAFGRAGETMTAAQETFDAEQANIKNNYENEIRQVVKEVEDSMRDTKFRADYDSEKSGLEKGSKYNSGSKVLSTYTTPTTDKELKTINFESFQQNPESPTVDTTPIQSITIDDERGGGRSAKKGAYFKTIRKSRTCFIGSTKVLMGGINE